MKLDEIRKEQELTNRKIGTLAEGMVSIHKRLDDLHSEQARMNGELIQTNKRLDRIEQHLHVVTIAIDEHTARLDRIETLLPHHDA